MKYIHGKEIEEYDNIATTVINEMKSLYNEDIADVPPNVLHLSKYQEWKIKNKYRKAEASSGKKCRFCEYLISCCSGKVYYKCKWLGISRSTATDIRLGHVCNLYNEFEDIK